MKTQTHTTLIALILSVGISAAWLGAVAIGIQSPTQPSLSTFVLHTVVVVARKTAAPQTAPQPQASPVKIS